MKLHQINEDDLKTLEELLPALLARLQSAEWKPGDPQNELKVKMRQIQRIIVDVRWNYGPPTIVDRIPADGPVPTSDDTEQLAMHLHCRRHHRENCQCAECSRYGCTVLNPCEHCRNWHNP